MSYNGLIRWIKFKSIDRKYFLPMLNYIRSPYLSYTFLIFCIGVPVSLYNPIWNRTMDLAMFQSGIIQYPGLSPMKSYFETSNIFVSLFAILLKIGLSPIFTANISTWLVTSLFLLNMSLPVYYLSRSKIFSLLTIIPIIAIYSESKILGILHFVYWLPIKMSAVTYPALGPFTTHTPGLFGLLSLMLVINLYLIGAKKSGGFLAAVAVAIHPFFGALSLIFWALFNLIESWRVPKNFFSGNSFKIFLIGIIISLFFLDLYEKSENFSQPNSLMKVYLENWDFHRSPSLGYDYKFLAFLVIFSFYICMCVAYIKISNKFKHYSIITFKALILFAMLSLAGLSYHLYASQNIIDNPVSRLQVGRMSLILGYLFTPYAIALVYLLVEKTRIFQHTRIDIPIGELGKNYNSKFNTFFTLLIFVIFLIYSNGPLNSHKLVSCSPTIIHKSVLVTQSTALEALRACRAPILLDPTALDFLPYFPNELNVTKKIIELGYGISFANPPESNKNRASISDESFRETWESRSQDEWNKIGVEIGFDAVAVPLDWSLKIDNSAKWTSNIKVYFLKEDFEFFKTK